MSAKLKQRDLDQAAFAFFAEQAEAAEIGNIFGHIFDEHVTDDKAEAMMQKSCDKVAAYLNKRITTAKSGAPHDQ